MPKDMPTPECRVAAAAWAAAHRTGFRMGVNNALKRITFFFPALRTLLLSYLLSSNKGSPSHGGDAPRATMRRAVERPLLVDIGAAGYGPPEYSDGSDALLLLKRLTGVPCEVHGFEMQPSQAAALEKEAAALLAEPGRRGSSFSVHRLGVGAAPALLHAEPLPGMKPKARTVTLTPQSSGAGSPRIQPDNKAQLKKRKQLSRTVNVTSLDAWAAPFDRPLMYLKVDTNGHEPAILHGMQRLLNSAPPLYLSFEYSSGWSEELTALARRPPGANESAGLTSSALRVSLRAFVSTLHAAGYHAYLLHSDGLRPIHGGWWDDGCELLLSDSSSEVYDFFAARHGPPARALETLFFHAPLPCIPVTARSTKRPGLSGYDLCTAATSSVAKQLEPACLPPGHSDV